MQLDSNTVRGRGDLPREGCGFLRDRMLGLVLSPGERHVERGFLEGGEMMGLVLGCLGAGCGTGVGTTFNFRPGARDFGLGC